MLTILEQLRLCKQYNTNTDNNSICLELDFFLQRKFLVNCLTRLIKDYKVLSFSYDIANNEKYRVKVKRDFIEQQVTEVFNEDNQEILERSQNKGLDIEQGKCWRLLLNHSDNKSSLILTINHTVADGTSLYIIASLLMNLINRQYGEYYLKTFMLKFKDLLDVFQPNILKATTKYIYQEKPSTEPSPDAIIKLRRITYLLPSDKLLAIKNRGLNGYITAISLLAHKEIFPNEENFMLKKLIGLRGRVKGVHRYKLGEYNTATKYYLQRKDISDISQIEAFLKNRFNPISQDIATALSNLRTSFAQHIGIVDCFKQNFSVEQPSIGISTFGIVKPLNRVTDFYGITAPISGPKPYILVIAGIIDTKLSLGIHYNERYISPEQLNTFVNVLVRNVEMIN